MREERLKTILILFGSGFMLMFCLLPFLYMIAASVSTNAYFAASKIPFEFTWKNYEAIFTTKSLHLMDYLQNSLVVSSTSATIAVLVCCLAAYAITRLDLPGGLFVLISVLAVSMFPQISLVSYLFKYLAKAGWINTYKGLVLPYVAWTIPLSLWILVSYLVQIPAELDRAALVDGCSRWKVLWKVIFPVASPGIFSTALLAFIFTFNEFLFALMLTTDHQARTIPVGIALFQGLHGETPWGNIMAASTFSILPVVALTLVFQKRIVQGLTRGAIKG